MKAYWHDWDTSFYELYNDIGPGGVLTGTQSVNSDNLFWGFEDYGLTAVAEIRPAGSVEYAVGYDYQRFWGEDEVWLIEDKTEEVQAVYGQIRSSDSALENTDLAFGLRYNTLERRARTRRSGTSAAATTSATVSTCAANSARPSGCRMPRSCICATAARSAIQTSSPRKARNVEIGFGGTSDAGAGLSWEFIYFTREIENLIDIDFDNPAFPDGRFENFDEKVESDGWEFNLTAGLSDTMSVSFDYTSNDAQFAGTSVQVQDIPESFTKLGWQYIGTSVPLELNVAVLNVGEVYDVVGGGVGRVDHGEYTVVDLGAAYYFDADRHHRIGVRLENALDEDYATSIGRGRLDLNNASYAYRNLGAPRCVPRDLHLPLLSRVSRGQAPVPDPSCHQPHCRPAFCCFSQVISGSKYATSAEPLISREPMKASRASGHGLEAPSASISLKCRPTSSFP